MSITDNFCEACKSADIVLYLSRDLERGCHGNTTVEVCCNSLTDINFYGLGCALHPFQRDDSVGLNEYLTQKSLKNGLYNYNYVNLKLYLCLSPSIVLLLLRMKKM